MGTIEPFCACSAALDVAGGSLILRGCTLSAHALGAVAVSHGGHALIEALSPPLPSRPPPPPCAPLALSIDGCAAHGRSKSLCRASPCALQAAPAVAVGAGGCRSAMSRFSL